MIELGSGDNMIKFAPPVAGVATDAVATFLGFSMNEWFYAAMIIYAIIMAVNDFLDKRSARKLRQAEFDLKKINPKHGGLKDNDKQD